MGSSILTVYDVVCRLSDRSPFLRKTLPVTGLMSKKLWAGNMPIISYTIVPFRSWSVAVAENTVLFMLEDSCTCITVGRLVNWGGKRSRKTLTKTVAVEN